MKKKDRTISEGRAPLLRYAAPMGFVLLLAVLTEFLARTDRIQSFIIPAPTAVFFALFNNFKEIRPHLGETLWVCTAGLILSIAAALIIAVIMDGISFVRDMIYPLIVASQAIPIMVITPIIILLMGFGITPRLLVVVLVCFFPIAISLYDGLQSADPDMIILMRSLNAGRWQIFRHVKFPSSLPALFSGIRISATYCVMATVIAEWQGSNSGLGVYLMRVKRSYAYDKMFAAILLIVLVSLAFFLIAQIAEKRAVVWKRSRKN
ncbi:MAG: ABC transporter permease [Saccharofermentanales bacterium]